ncbi:alpha/beta fold hydrolase [Nakamurella leprariae]|uniref:Alpha/beta fold hydrolase n=1 Tax=Nakamurella leprariae TaxID=2803911 RepID=A0A939C3U0_9ACTN|nr:alpha/beta fold hydrolase [Nakamurella leprariae]MBM9469407.1 alpha/beta fold hydrolase [Nakamurella leprariae]
MTSSLAVRPTLAPLADPVDARSVAHRWRAVVTAVGCRPAITSPGRAYSYREADERSARLGAALRSRVPAGSGPIGLLLGHDADCLVTMLAVIRTGRPVVVLDAHMPADRLRTIADLGRLAAVVTDAGHAGAATAVTDCVPLVVDAADLLDGAPTDPDLPDPAVGLDDPLSIIFTSGSTGRPKGVVITHGQTLNDGWAIRTSMRLTGDDRCATVMPLGFLAGFDFALTALLCGATAHVVDPRDLGVAGLVDELRQEAITATFCTPHLARSLAPAMPAGSRLDALRVVATAGEAVHGRDVTALRPAMAHDGVFVNVTGSSEVASFAAFRVEADDPVPAGPVPAGTPVPNKHYHLVDEDGVRVPEGTPGHLVITSRYLSGGYCTDPELTAERFRIDERGERYHRQSDTARIDDGVLTLLGRDDAAVKVRGYFVDPSEVEHAIRDSPSVHEVVVVPVKTPDAPTFLAAYVVPDPRAAVESVAALRRRLRDRLPEYMVPAVLVPLAALPRTERGKVDRTALPPAHRRPAGAPPTTQWELVVADLWSELLGLDGVGLDDDFMAMGADSLVAEQMLAAAADRFGVQLVTSDLVESPTLREFSRRISLGTSSLPTHPDVVALGGRGAGTPVFCFAGGGSLALGFAPIASHLGDRPVYAFQAHGLEWRATPDRTVQAATDRALALLRVLQPRGPYVLLGHSFGGLLALEAARRLSEAGEEVALVAMLDTFLIGGPASQQRSPSEAVEAAAPRSGRIAGALRGALPAGLPERGQWGRHLRGRLAGVVPFRGQRQFDAFFDHTVRIAQRHRLQPWDGDVLLLAAQDYPYREQDWAPLLPGRLQVRDLACEHSSMIREPHASTVAEHLRAELAAREL